MEIQSMSQPFSGIPDPGTSRPFKRSIQPGVVQEGLRRALRQVRPYSEKALRDMKRLGEDWWRRGKRNPRVFALVGGALVLTLAGAYALSATGAGRSLCPPGTEGKERPFLLLMDPVPPAAKGAKIEVHYEVCGLPSGTAYKGRIQLSQKPAGKKAVKPKPVVVKFQDKVDGTASRHERQVELGSAKPGEYSLVLTVVDDQGRVRKKQQKVQVK
jgi:hypothetical protein